MTHSGGKPHNVGDKGQRFEVTYFDPYTSTRKVFGWAHDKVGVDIFFNSINLHPSMELPEMTDRQGLGGEG